MKTYSEDFLYHWTTLHYICVTCSKQDSSICANCDSYVTENIQVIQRYNTSWMTY